MTNEEQFTDYQRVKALADKIDIVQAISERLKELSAPSSMQNVMPSKWYPTAMLIGIARDVLWIAEQQMTDIHNALAATMDTSF